MKPGAKINTMNTPVNGTDGREARSFRWFAARTQMNCERKAAKEFERIAEETYLPTQEEIHVWSDRKKKIQRIVIPTILFVKMSDQEANRTHRTAYFCGFLGYNRHDTKPAPIPDKEIEILRFMLGHSDTPVAIESKPVKLGDKVKVIRGSLKGLEGNVLYCSDVESYLYVRLDILNCGAKVKLQSSDIIKL
jgi:transcription antitermination factor NusG